MKVSQELKQAAFKAFASIGANDEEIRKRVRVLLFLRNSLTAGDFGGVLPGFCQILFLDVLFTSVADVSTCLLLFNYAFVE